MTPGAQIQAVIELIAALETGFTKAHALPADLLLGQYFKARRYIGSKDRGVIAERVYFILRHRAALLWWIQRLNHTDDGRMLVIASLVLFSPANFEWKKQFDDERHHPEHLGGQERQFALTLAGQPLFPPEMPDAARLNYPEWMDGLLRERFGSAFENEMQAMNEEAPVDLRVNTLKATREQVMEALMKEGFAPEPIALLPNGVRLAKRGPIFATVAFRNGWFEMQDAGSQLLAAAVDAEPGQRVIDFCAGAGGKTLALAAAMRNKGRILALDVSASRLEQMIPRLRRAGADNVQRHTIESESDAFLKRHKFSADRVLVDAPCSGTGTWRRNPDLKWRFTEKDLQELIDLQERILLSAARLVKPGGRLIYATCSLLESENERQIESFLTKKNNFRVVSAQKIWDKNFPEEEAHSSAPLRLSPQQDGTDGFFAAILENTDKNPSL